MEVRKYINGCYNGFFNNLFIGLYNNFWVKFIFVDKVERY